MISDGPVRESPFLWSFVCDPESLSSTHNVFIIKDDTEGHLKCTEASKHDVCASSLCLLSVQHSCKLRLEQPNSRQPQVSVQSQVQAIQISEFQIPRVSCSSSGSSKAKILQGQLAIGPSPRDKQGVLSPFYLVRLRVLIDPLRNMYIDLGNNQSLNFRHLTSQGYQQLKTAFSNSKIVSSSENCLFLGCFPFSRVSKR